MLEFNPISGLNGDQSREYNRAQALALCLSEEIKIYSLYPPFADEATLFFNNNKTLISLVPGKNSNGATITESKDALKAAIALSANIIAARTAAYAIKIEDKDLQAEVYHSISSINTLKDSDVLGFVTRFTDIVSPLLSKPDFMPYAVTADMLSALTENAASFNASIGKADFANSKKSYVSEAIDEVLKSIRANIVQFNLLLNFFTEKYPEFVKEYTKAIAIDYSGIRHSGIEGTIINTATGQPIKDATITGEGKKKVATSDMNGAYRLIKLKVTNMKITIAAAGYETKVIDVKIIRGKIFELNISLQAQVVSMSATA